MITTRVLKSACEDKVKWQPCVDQCAGEVNWFYKLKHTYSWIA